MATILLWRHPVHARGDRVRRDHPRSRRSRLVASGRVTSTSSSTTRRRWRDTRRRQAAQRAVGPGDLRLLAPAAAAAPVPSATVKVHSRAAGTSCRPSSAHISNTRGEARAARLSCQVAIKQDMKVVVPARVRSRPRSWKCKVRSATTTWPRSSRSWCWSFREDEDGRLQGRRLHPDRVPLRTSRTTRTSTSRRSTARTGTSSKLWKTYVSARRGAGDPRLLDGELPGREGHHHAERPRGDSRRRERARGRPSGQDVELHLQPASRATR